MDKMVVIVGRWDHHPLRPSTSASTNLKLKTFTFSLNFDTLHPPFRKAKHICVSNPATITTSSLSNHHNPNSHICQLCLLGNLDRAMSYLDSMHELRIPVEDDSYVALIRFCEWKRARKEGSRVYSYVSISMSHLSLQLGNSFLSMFVRFGNLVDAWYVFGRMEKRNLFSWNVLVGGYAKAGFFDEALDLYHRMLWVGVKPDVYTFPCVLRTCGGMPNLVRGREIHVHVIRYGFESDVDVVNALITMYVKCGDVNTARLVFDKMPNRDWISWNAMISGYFENGECLEGLRLFGMMIEYLVDPDLMIMTSVITACELPGDERLGRQIHGYILRTEFGKDLSIHNSLILMYLFVELIEEAETVFSRMECRDVVLWTAMISGYENCLMPQKAIETFKMMNAQSIMPDEITIAIVLSACSCLCNLDMGMNLHEVAKQTGLISYAIVANSLIDMYAKCKCIDKALEVFHSTLDNNIVSWTSIILGLWINNWCFVWKNGICLKQFFSVNHDVTAWNILLTGYAERGKGAHATELFQRMVESNVSPNEITFISILCACSRSGMVAEGLEYFNSMKYKYSIMPNLKHYACVVDLLCRSGKLEEAYEFIQKMPMKPDLAVWGALLNACRIHHNVKLGELAAENIFQDDTTSVGYYILLSNLYADNGKWDEVAEVRKMMRQNGLIVDPGCSWVEVKGTVHAFLSGDNFHPQIKEINALLERFCKKMKEASVEGPESSHMDIMEASKADIFCGHSERLAIVFGLINSGPGMPIWVTKNLYMCQSCHNIVKFISREVRREISVRDAEQFHHFKGGIFSCKDEGYRS
ncbi:Pentatricopeptide repeat-containing protein, chloroplastic [Glycine soja]|uniref:Pentatricopeptide repeat-containing protein, chloroplastic n=1 Tax=Glycine soja TaxID=3848 RepID=A0A445JHP6_GLYSO|nr:Pentatricopeptide repeat-containing protein, chloroplastic [Glycine soja]